MTDTVTLNKAHFEALLRKAEFSTQFASDSPYAEPFAPANVSVSRPEYEKLRQSAHEYETLRNALLGGGIALETLDILIYGEAQQPRKDSGFASSIWNDASQGTNTPVKYSRISASSQQTPCTAQRTASGPPTSGRPADYAWRPSSQDFLRVPNQEMTWQQQSSFGVSYPPMSFEDAGDGLTGYGTDFTADNTPFPRLGQRTIHITGLSDRITYKHLTDVIRGGRIVYINLRGDRTATVFMLEGAAEFLAYVKRHDLYVETKRLEVKWNDHQFALSPYVGRKIAAGSSRNLILYNAARVVNIAEIREHMEHIHQFDIIHVEVRRKDVLIYTNSVHNALFARTCMISRKPYKGLRIGFLPDECAAPIPVMQPNHNYSASSVSSKISAPGNLLMLSLDSSDAENRPPGREDDDDDDTVDGDDSDFGVSLTAGN